VIADMLLFLIPGAGFDAMNQLFWGLTHRTSNASFYGFRCSSTVPLCPVMSPDPSLPHAASASAGLAAAEAVNNDAGCIMSASAG